MILNLAVVVVCVGAIAISSLSIIFAIGNARVYINDYKRETSHCKSIKDWYYRLDQDYTGDTHSEHYDLCRAKDSYQRALRDQHKAFTRLLVEFGVSIIFGFGGAFIALMSIHYMSQHVVP